MTVVQKKLEEATDALVRARVARLRAGMVRDEAAQAKVDADRDEEAAERAWNDAMAAAMNALQQVQT